MLLLFVLTSAQAQETPPPDDEPTPPEAPPPPPEAPTPPPPVTTQVVETTTPERWVKSPYVHPILDFTIYDPGGLQGAYTIVNLGLEGGLIYFLESEEIPTWAGRTRVSGYYGFGGEGVQSWELRVGSFMGPVFKRLSLESGLDFFGNQLTIDGDGQVASAGIDVPLLARLDLTIPSVWGGIGTAYLFDKERRVDWSETDQFGFGHEYQYVIGAGLKAGIRLSVEYTHRIVVTGDEETIMLGAGI